MWHKECWKKLENGHYHYKNGVTVKKENNKWVVYTVYNDKRNVLLVRDTLAACKYWLANNYK